MTEPGGAAPLFRFTRSMLDEPIGTLFARQVAHHPHRLAVKSSRHALTYAELDAAANRLARAILARRGPGPEPVALLFAHDAPLLVAVVAVLKAGKTYVALDPYQPAPRHTAILADAEPSLMVCDAGHRGRARDVGGMTCEVLDATALEGGVAPEAPALVVSPRAPACICYTSGSTGAPKGVVWDHRGIVHRVMILAKSAGLRLDDRVALLQSVSATASFRNIFSALLTGAALVLFDLRAEGPGALARWLTDEKITIVNFASSVFRHFAGGLTGGGNFPALRLIWAGSEPVFKRDVDLFRAHFARSCVFVNGMGTSEAGTVREFPIDMATPIEGDQVPVGYALPDKEVLLLDDQGNEVAPGEAGEIVVRSEFLAMGYWRRPDLDREVFVPAPAGGSGRLCRTGDVGRMLPDGCLVHLGRKDARAKLRGGFVDPLGVEAVLLAHPAVAGTAVAIREDRPGDQRLTAYVVSAPGVMATVSELRHFVRTRLGAHLVPAAFVFLDALPQTPNGKIDRRALPPPGRARPRLATPYTAPRTPVEEAVARIWSAALDLDGVGVDDDFLELGGDSLLAGSITAQVCERFGVDVPVTALLEASRVADMAAVVVEHLLGALPPEARDRLLATIDEAIAQREAPPAGSDTGA